MILLLKALAKSVPEVRNYQHRYQYQHPPQIVEHIKCLRRECSAPDEQENSSSCQSFIHAHLLSLSCLQSFLFFRFQVFKSAACISTPHTPSSSLSVRLLSKPNGFPLSASRLHKPQGSVPLL